MLAALPFHDLLRYSIIFAVCQFQRELAMEQDIGRTLNIRLVKSVLYGHQRAQFTTATDSQVMTWKAADIAVVNSRMIQHKLMPR